MEKIPRQLFRDGERHMKRASSQYWFPILIPVFIGLLLPLLQLQSNISETETLEDMSEAVRLFSRIEEFISQQNEDSSTQPMDDQSVNMSDQSDFSITDIFKTDLRSFISQATKNLVVSVITIDVWAFTMLFTIRYRTHESNLAFAPPVIALFLHMCLMIGAASIPGTDDVVQLMLEGVILLIAVAAAIWVREVIWKNIDGIDYQNNNPNSSTTGTSS